MGDMERDGVVAVVTCVVVVAVVGGIGHVSHTNFLLIEHSPSSNL